MNQYPSLNSSKSRSMRYAVHGFTDTVPTCTGFNPSLFSILSTCFSSASACVRHVPKPVLRMITQSPFCNPFMADPTEVTRKEPSLPATALGRVVPRREVKGGLDG